MANAAAGTQHFFQPRSASEPAKPEPLSVIEGKLPPFSHKIAELKESGEELVSRIQKLKQDVQSWRTKLDAQEYHDELSDLKTLLNTEVDQLKTEFQGLGTALQQQQLQDDVGIAEEVEGSQAEENKYIVGDPTEDHTR